MHKKYSYKLALHHRFSTVSSHFTESLLPHSLMTW